MPFVDLCSQDDYASIWYTTNSLHGNVSGFDPEKPAIIMLHPLFLDSSWLENQFDYPRLNDNYNIIAFDMRICGKSSARPSGRHDSWVEAADLAFCHQSLHLPPCHIFALEVLSVYCALRFAVLFPEMCLSLTLCNIPSPTVEQWIVTAYDELLHSWCTADDLETFEHVASESVDFMMGSVSGFIIRVLLRRGAFEVLKTKIRKKECDVDLRDDLIEYWEIYMPPFRRVRIAEMQASLITRTPLTREMSAAITVPVLIIQGQLNEACPVEYAEQLAEQLVNCKDGAIVFTVKGGYGTLSVVPGLANITNGVFAKFIARLPHARSDLRPLEMPTEERMKMALATLAQYIGDASIASRDPASSLSFSCLTPDVVRNQNEILQRYRKGQATAFSPLGPDGRPLRRYSERKREHWFHSEKDGLSIAGTSYLTSSSSKQDSDRADNKSSPLEPPQDSRVKRTTYNSSSVDKQVIKGSMAKVAGSAPATPFQRLLS